MTPNLMLPFITSRGDLERALRRFRTDRSPADLDD